MDRRGTIVALAGLAAMRVAAQDAPAPAGYRIALRTLQDAVAARFPLRYGLAGLVQLQVGAPGLFVLPARNKLGAKLQAEVSGAELRRPQTGELDLAGVETMGLEPQAITVVDDGLLVSFGPRRL